MPSLLLRAIRFKDVPAKEKRFTVEFLTTSATKEQFSDDIVCIMCPLNVRKD